MKRMLKESKLSNEGHMDNYYQCPNLARDLLLEGTNSVGTSRFARLYTPVELKASSQVFTIGQMDY